MLTQRQLFLDHLAPTSYNPMMLEVEKAQGIYITDIKGKQYIDLISGIGVSSVGHRHPKVVRAIIDQLEKHLHVMVYGEFIQKAQVNLAKELCNTLPKSLNSVYLVNSGSEAIEGAMKLAKRYTKKSKIISCLGAYHGSTQGALSLNGEENIKRNFRPLLPNIFQIKYGNENDLSQITGDTAAIFLETVQGEAGVRIANTQYWKALRKKCDSTGTLLVLDEVQCGFGRTGTFWAFENYNIIPDILITAKGMGGGMPIGCFIANRKIMQSLTENPILGHITTFGGHPLSAAASYATILTIKEEDLLKHVKEKEYRFKKLLKHSLIKEIRSYGLLIAVEFNSFELLKRIIDKLLEKGIITDWFLFDNRSMRIAPPLTITFEEINIVCQKILTTLDDILLDTP